MAPNKYVSGFFAVDAKTFPPYDTLKKIRSSQKKMYRIKLTKVIKKDKFCFSQIHWLALIMDLMKFPHAMAPSWLALL